MLVLQLRWSGNTDDEETVLANLPTAAASLRDPRAYAQALLTMSRLKSYDGQVWHELLLRLDADLLYEKLSLSLAAEVKQLFSAIDAPPLPIFRRRAIRRACDQLVRRARELVHANVHLRRTEQMRAGD
jgi:hypothetical protein